MEGLFLDILPPWFALTASIMLGLLCGSFLNVVIYRLPRGLNLAYPPSACPHCNTPIKPYDNIPVVSWLLLLGRSRCCKQPISPRYPLIELLGGLMAGAITTMKLLPHAHELGLWHAVGLFWLYLALLLGLVASAAIDFEHMLLPDSISYGGIVLGLLSAPLRFDITDDGTGLMWAAIGACAGFVGIWLPFIWLHRLVRGFDGMGMGDAKLVALTGAWLGPWGALLTLFAAALQGTLFSLIAWLVTGKISEPAAVTQQREELLQAIAEAEGEEKAALEKELADDPLGLPPDEAPGGPRVAFGPFLALATIELVLFSEPLWNLLRVYMLL